MKKFNLNKAVGDVQKINHNELTSEGERKRFCGDPTSWPEFIDTFNVAIHNNVDLTPIEKFTLKVTPEAKRRNAWKV